MSVEKSKYTEHEKYKGEGENGNSRTGILEQKACQCDSQWSQTKGNESMRTVETTSELVGRVCHTITHVDCTDQGYTRRKLHDRQRAGQV